jgi:hypothetical protein
MTGGTGANGTGSSKAQAKSGPFFFFKKIRANSLARNGSIVCDLKQCRRPFCKTCFMSPKTIS